MSDWRDDLPPIPVDRIRSDAIREGTHRRERRARRQRTILLGGLGAAAVALIIVAGVETRPTDESGDAATEATAPSATQSPSDAAATTGRVEASGTEDPTGDQASDTTAAAVAPEDTEAEATTGDTESVDHTTIDGPGSELPVNTSITVVPATIWEAPPPGGPACGPTSLEVLVPDALGLRSPVVRWQTADLNGEVPTNDEAGGARATIGPFGPDSLGAGVRHELLLVVAGLDDAGALQLVRAPSAVLVDCS